MYNGWANWATWNVMLWANNEEPWYREHQEWARNHKRPITADDCKEFFFLRKGAMFPNGTPDMKFKSDMSKVDWQEIADVLNSEVKENETRDDMDTSRCPKCGQMTMSVWYDLAVDKQLIEGNSMSRRCSNCGASEHR